MAAALLYERIPSTLSKKKAESHIAPQNKGCRGHYYTPYVVNIHRN